MKKRIVKVLAVFMSFALLHNLVGLPASASSTLAECRMTQAILAARVPVPAMNERPNIAPELADSPEQEAVPIVSEVYELRDATTRHFRHADGSFTAAIFPQPVHFLAADGTWQDIDNTLIFDGEAFVPVASDLDVRIPQSFADGQQMTISQDGFTLGLGVSMQNEDVSLDAQASVIEEPVQAFAMASMMDAELSVEEQNAEIMAAENLEGSVLYADLFAGASMEQIVTPSGVETAIFIPQMPENLEFLFDLSLDGLVAVPQADGSIFFFAAADVVNVLTIERAPIVVEIPAEEPQDETDEDEMTEEDATYYNENDADEETSLEENDDYDVLQELYPAEEIALERELEIVHLAPIQLGIAIEGAEPVFILQAPMMVDANGEMAVAEMAFAEDGTLVIRADAEFMSAAAYPVTISPKFRGTPPPTAIYDIYVTTATYATSYNHNFIGSDLGFFGLGSNLRRTYAKFDLPTLPHGSTVIAAEYVIFRNSNMFYETFSDDNFIGVFAIPAGEDYEWHPNEMGEPVTLIGDLIATNWRRNSWYTQPGNWADKDSAYLRPHLIDLVPVRGDMGYFNFDITRAVRNWYEIGGNNGLMFAMRYEDRATQVRLVAAQTRNNDYAVLLPRFIIRYATNVSLQPHLTYEIFEMGRSGTAFVNVHNGNMTWVHETISMPGERLPIQISHIYNSSHNENFRDQHWNMRLSMMPGFRLSVIEHLTRHPHDDIYPPNPACEAIRYTLVDGFGVVHRFRNGMEDGERIIRHELDSTWRVTDSGSITILTDAQGNQRHFNMSHGFMTRMNDRHSNYNRINWVDGRITSVVDSIGRNVTFNYHANGLLLSLTDQAGREISFANINQGRGFVFIYPDGRNTRFLLSDYLDQMDAYDGSFFDFRYAQTAHLGRRVTSVERLGTRSAMARPLDYITLEFSETNISGTATGHTTLRNREYIESDGERGRRDVYLFNPFGGAQSITSRQGQTQITNFHDSAEDLARLNQVASSSEWLTISNNLLRNHGFEANGYWWRQGSAAPVTRTTAESMHGDYSLQLSSSEPFTLAGQYFVAQPGQVYTLSADLLVVEDLQGTGGASLGFNWGNQQNLVVSQPVRSTNGWERISFTFTLPSDVSGEVSANLILFDAEGTVFFDNVQLEQSGGPRHHNLIENSDFRFNTPGGMYGDIQRFIPENWTLYRGSNRNNLAPISLADGSESVRWNEYSGNYFFAVGGLSSRIQMVTQNVPLNASAGETLIIGGIGYAYALPPRNGSDSRFEIQARIFYACGYEPTNIHIPFDALVPQARQKAIGYHTLERDAVRVEFSFVYAYQINSAAFRDAFIYVAPFGQHIEYDDDGQPVAMSSGAGDSLHIEYDNHQPTRIEQRHGGRVTSSLSIEYHDNGEVGRVTDEETGMTTSFTYDNWGNVTSRTITNGELSLTETMLYTLCGNFVREHTDFNGNTNTFTWDVNRGWLLSETDPRGNTVTYTYCPTTDRLLSVSGRAQQWQWQEITTNFGLHIPTASSSRTVSITRSHRGGSYAMHYDRGRLSTAMVGNVRLVTNTYEGHFNDQLIQQLFANGDRFEPVYDNRGRLIAEYWNGVRAVTYYYNENDRLSQLIDHTGDEDLTQRFDYDFAGRLVRVSGSDGLNTHITYDANGAPTLLRTELNGEVIHDSLFLTNMQGQPMDASFFALGASLSYGYDGLNRPVQRSLIMPNAAVSTSLSFTDNLITTFRNELFGGALLHEWEYEYDAAGNITRIVDHDGRETRFAYDGLNRLTSEWIDGILWEYEFDAGGNITRVRRDGITQHTFSYGNNNWPDQLTAFDGRTITYDPMGNPLTYGNYSFTWERGRLLTRIYYNGELLHRFGYDAAGRRVSRISYDGLEPVTTRFYYMGQQLVRQCDGIDTLDFTWDADGRPVGFTHNGTPYFYLHNLLGDVVAIAGADGNIVAEYTYDAWGNVTVYAGARELPPSPLSAPIAMQAMMDETVSPEDMLAAILSLMELDADALDEFAFADRSRSHAEPAAFTFAEPLNSSSEATESNRRLFAERMMLRSLLAQFHIEESTMQALIPGMLELGLSDRAALQRYFHAHGSCERNLDMLLEMGIGDSTGLIEWTFIPALLGELDLDTQGMGIFAAFLVYYANIFTGLVELFGAYLGVEPNAELLQEFTPILAAVLNMSFELMTEEAQAQIRAHVRGPMLLHAALVAAGVPEAELNQLITEFGDINDPERAVWYLMCCCNAAMTEEQAIAQIFAWKLGENTNHLASFLASRFPVCCCEYAEFGALVSNVVIPVLYANFAQMLQDWYDVFMAEQPEPGPCTCPACGTISWNESLFWRRLLTQHGFDEAQIQSLLPGMIALGMADVWALREEFHIHNLHDGHFAAVLSYLEDGILCPILLVGTLTLIYLGDLELRPDEWGWLGPFMSYYSHAFSGLVQLFDQDVETLTLLLTAILGTAFDLLLKDMHNAISVYVRAPQLVQDALLAAGVTDSVWIDQLAANYVLSINSPQIMFDHLVQNLGLTEEQAIAQIRAWRAGDTNLVMEYLELRLPDDVDSELLDIILQVLYNNFVQLLNEWFGLFEWTPPCLPHCRCPECLLACEPSCQCIGCINPIRYRGKFYCDSMGWYWLQTRFYNPQWRRFINADTFFIAGEDGLSALTASNMFAYANGNPVMMIDPDGRMALAIIGLGLGLIMGWIVNANGAPLLATLVVILFFSAVPLIAELLNWRPPQPPDPPGEDGWHDPDPDLPGDDIIGDNDIPSNTFQVDGLGWNIDFEEDGIWIGAENPNSRGASALSFSNDNSAVRKWLYLPVQYGQENVRSVLLFYDFPSADRRTARLSVNLGNLQNASVTWNASSHANIVLPNNLEQRAITVSARNGPAQANLTAGIYGPSGGRVGTTRSVWVTSLTPHGEAADGAPERIARVARRDVYAAPIPYRLGHGLTWFTYNWIELGLFLALSHPIHAGNAIDSLGTFGNFHLVAGENNNGHLVGGFVHQVDILTPVNCPPLAYISRGTAAQYLAMNIGWPLGDAYGNERRDLNRISFGHFGERRADGPHAGIDLVHPNGAGLLRHTPILAVVDGYIRHRNATYSGQGPGYRVAIAPYPPILCPYRGTPLIFIYMHMEGPALFIDGTRVERGTVIGHVGRSGTWNGYSHTSSGHLHFEISNYAGHMNLWSGPGNTRWSRITQRINPVFFYPAGSFTGNTTMWNEVRW